MTQIIAHNSLLTGAPLIHNAGVFGGSPMKPFMMRIAATGERPMQFSVSGLPGGLELNGNIVTGLCAEGEYPLVITAENAIGKASKEILLRIAPDGMLQTPLLGFTTWNAFRSGVNQQNITDTANLLVSLGLAELGYNYVNVDSGWQGSYGGEYDAIQPNAKFPNMKAMYDYLHSLGLKGGIYSTPMLQAWGCPKEYEWIPGCTRGEADPLQAETNTGIGLEHLEVNNVRQWMEWGIDYLKYDWAPTEPVNADRMKQALLAAPREVGFCVTTSAGGAYKKYWSKNCCSWRSNPDSDDTWERTLWIFSTVDAWRGTVKPGHFYDLDMLAVGPMDTNNFVTRYTENEEIFAYTNVAFFASPIQLSMRLDKLNEFEFDLVSNDEVIAINQDTLCDYPELVDESEKYKLYRRKLSNGDNAYAVFNLSDSLLTGEIPLEAAGAVRNVWAKEALGVTASIPYAVEAHAAMIFRVH